MGEKWLACPTLEYINEVFQPLEIHIRKYIGFDDDQYYKKLKEKWKNLNLKEKKNKGNIEENFEKIKIWFHDHPNEETTSRGISKKISLDIYVPSSTIRKMLKFIIKNNCININIETTIYTKIFASNLFSKRKKKNEI